MLCLCHYFFFHDLLVLGTQLEDQATGKSKGCGVMEEERKKRKNEGA